MEPSPRSARRTTPRTPSENASDNIRLEPDANRQLTAAAKKLKLSKRQYASAAIAYFAQSGLNPTKELPKGLANVDEKVSQETRAIRVQNVDIGNRLIGIIRAWEKTLYAFMQLQQSTTLGYLEQIEKNIMAHQVAVETNLLGPMIEHVIRGRIEAYMARVLSEKTNLQITEGKQSNWAEMNGDHNGDRDNLLVNAMRDFIKTNNVPAPKLSVKPAVPTAPSKAIAAPSTSAVPPAAATPPAAVPPK
jgi:hypothetical protein